MSHSSSGRLLGLPLPLWLVALSAVPILGGIARLLQLYGSSASTPADMRFTTAPVPVTLHIMAAIVYGLVGAFQFDADLRRRRLGLHRMLGRFTAAFGVVVAVSGLWMTVASPIPPDLQGVLLRVARCAVGVGMALSLILGIVAIRAGQVRKHQIWMARAYALAQGAGTQALLLLPPTLVFGEVTGLSRDIVMTAAWLLNLCVVERALARRTLPLMARAA